MTNTRNVVKASIKGAAVALVALAGAVGGPAAALPDHEINWTYYSDATYSYEVGGWTISCSGNGGRWGVRTEYAILEYGPEC